MFYSFIIPAFNRPDEIRELLQSFRELKLPVTDFEGFEVILADGSPTPVLTNIVSEFQRHLSVVHLHRPKLPISPARNLGAQHAKGEYLIFLDSDVILPEHYLLEVHQALQQNSIDAFGGPDAAHQSFTDVQKAISFAMTSYLTTGGIRGGKKQIHNYNPRGFNMGIRSNVFSQLNGFSSFVAGEDIELSIRMIEAGYSVKLIPSAFVYHKRRTTFKSFFRQVYRFGAARVNIFYRHRSQLKITHLFPSAFMLFLVTGWLTVFFSVTLFKAYLILIGAYYTAIFISATVKEQSISVGFLSLIAATCQLCGYGSGLLSNGFAVFILGRKDGLALGASK